MKKLVLKNHFLLGSKVAMSLQDFLLKHNLHGTQSRARNRFNKLLDERITEIRQERFDLLDNYADKNKKKEVLFLDKDGKETTDKVAGVNYKITPENFEKVNEEYEKYLKEDFIIDITPANTESIYAVKDLLLKSVIDVKDYQAVAYDEWCTAFENIQEVEDVAKVDNKKENEEKK